MRKQFTILLILVFIFGLVPLDFSNAITQNQIETQVKIICPDSSGKYFFSGSGTIIDSKGIILTNKHVVTDYSGRIIRTCVVGFINSTNQEPNFYTENKLNWAEVKYTTTANDVDAALLYLENLANKDYSYIDIWSFNSENLKLGDKVEVIGFPSIGGATLTYSSGDFSGFGSKSNGTQNYLKATAAIEHGNSGGAAYNTSGNFLGIPTMVIKGELNSLSYILSINSIKQWLTGILGSSFTKKIEEKQPIISQQIIQKIPEDITPPYFDSGWFIKFYMCYANKNLCDEIGEDSETTGNSDKILLQTTTGILSLMDMKSKVVQARYSYSKKLSDLNEKNEIIYTLPDYDHKQLTKDRSKYGQCHPWSEFSKLSCEWNPLGDNGSEGFCCHYQLPITQWIKLGEPGEYYIGIRLADQNGNVSERQILKYIYQQPPAQQNNSVTQNNSTNKNKTDKAFDQKIISPKTNVYVRQSNNAKSKILGTAKKGASYKFIEEKSGWVKIKFNGKDGWVSKSYVNIRSL